MGQVDRGSTKKSVKFYGVFNVTVRQGRIHSYADEIEMLGVEKEPLKSVSLRAAKRENNRTAYA
jgi:hypothetical protein